MGNDKIRLGKEIFVVVFALALVMLQSCGPTKVVVQRDTTIVTKTEYIERWRDSIIEVPVTPDSVAVSVCDTSSHLAIKEAISDASIKDGVLTHSLYTNPSYAPSVAVKVKEVERVRDSLVYINNEIPVEVEKELSWWQQTMIRLGYVLLAILAGALGWYAIKIFLKR